MSNPEERSRRASNMKGLFGKLTARRKAGDRPSLEQLAEAMADLKQEKAFLLLRDDGWSRLFEMFVQFCEAEQTSPAIKDEILAIQNRASILYGELHRPEEIVQELAELRQKEKEHGGEKVD